MPDSKRCNCSRSVACCLRNLSHADEFILRAKVSGERRAAIQVNQIHRTANQITDPRAHAIENRRWQTGNSQVEIGSGITRPMCSRTEDIKLPCAGGLEFGSGALD